MAFSSEGRISKLEYASYLAASFAYMMQAQKDAVGLSTFDTKIRDERPASSTRVHLFELLRVLEKTVPGGETSAAKVFGEIAQRIRRRGLVLILSDLYDDPDGMIRAIKQFRYRGHEVIVFHIVDPLEMGFKFKSETLFRDLETGEKLQTQPWVIREEYQKSFLQYVEKMRFALEDSQADYELIDTAKPFDVALMAYLHKRGKLS
jgi:uncharacterized protein (DUF58 family)